MQGVADDAQAAATLEHGRHVGKQLAQLAHCGSFGALVLSPAAMSSKLAVRKALAQLAAARKGQVKRSDQYEVRRVWGGAAGARGVRFCNPPHASRHCWAAG